MSHQSVLARLNEKKASGASPSQSPVQSSSGICIKQEYFKDKPSVTVKTESQSPPNQHHNIMESIKVEVKEEEEVEHFYDQDCRECLVKRELDFEEDEQTDTKRSVKFGLSHTTRECSQSIASGTSSSSFAPPQSTSGICIKQEYFEDQFLVNEKTEPQSPPNQHNLLESIKVEVKEEVHYDEQDCRECVVKRELDYDEQLDTERPVKRQPIQQMNGADANDGQVKERIKVIHLNCTEENCQVKSNSLDQLYSHLLTSHGLFPLRCFAQSCNVRCDNCHHSNATQFVCNVCDKEFFLQKDTCIHWHHSHLTGQFECNLNGCRQVFATRQKVHRHQHYKHCPESKRLKCARDGCSSSFVFKNDLARHELTHLDTRPFHCTWLQCSHSANLRSNLLKHIRMTHFGYPRSLKEQKEKKIEDHRDPNEYVRVVVQGDE